MQARDLNYYEPCGAEVVGGLYTLNCGSSEGSTGADAAVGDADVDGSLLEVPPVISGAVDARVGAGLLGVDIGSGAISIVCDARIRVRTLSMPYPGLFGPILSLFFSYS